MSENATAVYEALQKAECHGEGHADVVRGILLHFGRCSEQGVKLLVDGLAELQIENREMQRKQLRDTLADLRARLAAAEKANEELRRERDDAKAGWKTAAEQRNELYAERDQLRAENAELKQHKDTAKTLADIVTRITAERDELKQRLEQANEKLREMAAPAVRGLLGKMASPPQEQAMEAMRANLAVLNKVKAERDALQARCERLTAFARIVEPFAANAAYNRCPHSEEARKVYDACIETLDLIYT